MSTPGQGFLRRPTVPAPTPATTTAAPAVVASDATPIVAPVVAPKRLRPIPNMLIVGESGWGKTRCLRNLPWASDTCVFLDTENKGFEWQDKIPDHRLVECRTPDGVLAAMRNAQKDTTLKYICVDGFTGFSHLAMDLCRAKYIGYDIYTQYGILVHAFLQLCVSKTQRIIVTAIPELLTADVENNTTGIVIKRAKVYGQQCAGVVEEKFAYSIYLKKTIVDGVEKYWFRLSGDTKSQAKMPESVLEHFKGKVEVVNDAWALLQVVEKCGQ